MNGKLGINNREYYESKSKKAEERRRYNKALIDGYRASLVREIDAALYGVPDHDNFVVAVDTVFEASRTGHIRRFKTYSFELHPPAVSSNGRVAARKKNKVIVLLGAPAKDLHERVVDECAKEFGLKKRYCPDRDSLPPELKSLADRDTGIIIADIFYPLTVEKKGQQHLTFKSQKDMRKAIMRALEPDFDLTDESWKCDFTEMNKIQRSVSTLSDWGVSKLQMTQELDKKLALTRRDFRKAVKGLQEKGLEQTKSKLETIQTKFEQINREYLDAKKKWEDAEKLKARKAKEYIQIRSECIRRIEQCGRRVELEVLPELEEVLKTDPKIGKLQKTKDATNRLGGMIDWAQRLSFVLQLLATIAVPH